MPTIHPPDAPRAPRGADAAAPLPATDESLPDERDLPDVSPLQATAIRVSAMIAVWLGY